jgi:hypothetical protein
VAHVLYYADPENPKRHAVISGKQRILGVDSVEDLEEHNQYCEMQLFTGLPNKIKLVEAQVEKIKCHFHTFTLIRKAEL